MWAVKLPVFVLGKVGKDKDLWVKAQIDDKAFIAEALNALSDPPSWFRFTPVDPFNGKLPKKSKLSIAHMMKLVRYFLWKVFGCVGNRNALHLAPRSIVENARRRKVQELAGPYNGKPLFLIS